ncbi:4Fe-4S ferredoxin [Desulforamulus ferrireducens]|uniref:4Fe-4S ferredoxin n=2 Tax=Desulforamulus ferrireducens TaxID=1833852 RepID=A0A1S6IVJ2_9FIRM|nr:4Fe-4S ferredoxin [Desulforamulus ferrireducens]
MGHIENSDREYQLLQKRLDHCIEGAPNSPVFISILKMLFTQAEANLARQIPLRPTPLPKLAKKIGMPVEALEEKITDMARRGLVFDAEHKGQRYVVLAPVVIGFFEFTFMRTRDNLPMAELAKLFDQYMMQDDKFAHGVFAGQTQIGRSLVREEALPDSDYAEILDWERASYIIESASRVGLSLCACRHKAEHLGKACDKPQQTCLTLNNGAKILIQNGLAEEISKAKALSILQQCKEQGLAQTADNVQRNVGYICNCCGCCCGMFKAMKTFNLNKAIVSSNWVMQIEQSKCTGCGACTRICPLGIISLQEEVIGDKKRRKASCSEDICLGCGVCYASCKFGAISLRPRSQRVFTPETTFDKIIMMAIERGKLTNLIFDDPSRLSHRALGRVMNIIEKSPPVKAVINSQPFKSVFLNTILAKVKKLADDY